MTDERFDAMAHFDDSLAARYDRRIRLFCPSYDALHRMIASWLRRLPEDAIFLSVGCGTGAEIVALGEHFPSWRFVGVDVSSDMLAACRRKIAEAGITSRTALFEGRLQQYAAPAPFDAASSIFVAHFIAGRDEKLSYFRSVASRLKPGGIFVLADLFGDKSSPEFERLSNAWLQSYASNGIATEELAMDRAHIERDIDFVPEADLVALLCEAGFVSVLRFYQTFLFGGWIAIRQSPADRHDPSRRFGETPEE
jgi:tRNA (cmo5U34)-methyltransferase